MTTAVAEHAQPAPIIWGSFNVFEYVPRMPGCALQVLFHLLGTQESGGRCFVTQTALSEELGIERTMVNRGVQHLTFARMLKPVQRGVYQLHPQLSAYETPSEQLEVLAAMPRYERLDVDDFEERYQSGVAEHEAVKVRQRNQRNRPASISQRRLKIVP